MMSDSPEGRSAGLAPPMIRVVRILDRVLSVPDLIASCFIGAGLIAIMATLFIGSFGRYLIGFSFVGGPEAARYLMVWITFIGMYLLIRNRSHIAIDILPRLAPFALTRWIGVAIGVLGTLMMLYMLCHGGELASRMLAGGQLSPVLPIPRGLLHLSMPVGAGLSTLAFLHMALSFLFDPETERGKLSLDEELVQQFDENAAEGTPDSEAPPTSTKR